MSPQHHNRGADISASLDLKINEEASSLLNNWLNELNMDEIVTSKVGGGAAKKPKSSSGAKTKSKKSAHTAVDHQLAPSAANRRHLSDAKRRSTRDDSDKTTMQNTTTKTTSSPHHNAPSSSTVEDQYLVANMLNRTKSDVHDTDMPSNMFIPQNNNDLEMLQIVETNRQLKALSSMSNQENLTRRRIWKSAHSPSSPSGSARNRERSPSHDSLNTSHTTSTRCTSRPSSASSAARRKRKSVSTTRQKNRDTSLTQQTSDMMLMGRTLDSLSPPPADSPTSKKQFLPENPAHKASPAYLRVPQFCPEVCDNKQKRMVEYSIPLQRPSSGFSRGTIRRPGSRGDSSAVSTTIRPSSATVSRSSKHSRTVTRKIRRTSHRAPPSPPSPQAQTSNFSDEEELEDPEILRIMNMTHADSDQDDNVVPTSRPDTFHNDDPAKDTGRDPQLRDHYAYSSSPQHGGESSGQNPSIASPQNALPYSEDFERREAERLNRMRLLQKRESQLKRMETERTFVDQTLFDASDIISASNPYINPRTSFSATSERSKSREKISKSKRSPSSRRQAKTSVEPANSSTSAGRYKRHDHPEIARQRILYKDLYEGHGDDDIEKEIEQKLRDMHHQLRTEREEKDKMTERLKQIEFERKQEEMERLRRERVRLQQEHEEKRLQHLEEKADEFIATRHLRTKRQLFLLWRSKYLPQIRRLKDIQYQLAWKKKSRFFLAWRHFVEKQSENRYEQHLQRRMIVEQQRQDAADQFYRMRTLTKFLVRWQFMYKISKQRREIKKTSKLRQEKISSLLQRLQSDAQETSPEPQMEQTPMVNSQTTPEPPTTGRSKKRTPTKKTRKTSGRSKKPSSTSASSNQDASSVQSDAQPLKSSQPTGGESIPDHSASQSTPTDTTHGEDTSSKPDPMKHMMERQKARLEARKALQEKYRLAEEEKDRQREEELKKQEELEKEQKRQLLLEKKRQAELKKQKEEEREKRREEYHQKREKADMFRLRACLKFYGFLPWKQFVRMTREQSRHAQDHHDLLLKRQTFSNLQYAFQLSQDEKQKQVQRAAFTMERFSNRFLLSQCLQAWNQNYIERRAYYAEIDHSHHVRVMTESFQHWRAVFLVVQSRRLEIESKQMDKAVIHSRKFTKKWFWMLWRAYTLQERECKREEQMATQLRSKVEGWLSDFRMQSDFDWDA
eukprot:CAMPEP_0117455236 /NCGR_PEP_ID=MMETSP0759-20121206/11254_1 /TAXON_ID=63605 /ORGANISM="Percolomonas cosmopolitus, Strain WS" /LENGTH=1183 /DNA_ID=CAMNT_0005248531 /DNA_START=134 /DNA_END=3686 /DNA_ORIENTATION=-